MKVSDKREEFILKWANRFTGLNIKNSTLDDRFWTISKSIKEVAEEALPRDKQIKDKEKRLNSS